MMMMMMMKIIRSIYFFVSKSLREFCAFHSPGRVLVCAYIICSYGQISIPYTIPSGSPFPPSRVESYTFFCGSLLYSLIMGLIISSLSPNYLHLLLLYSDLQPGQICHSKVMHRKEVIHSEGTYEEKSRRWTWLTKWDKVKFPWYTHRLMHWKRVARELHDSYFRLMTIKHAIPKIEWVLNYYITRSRQEVRQLGIRDVGDKCGRESHTRPKRPSGPPMEFWRPVGDKMQ